MDRINPLTTVHQGVRYHPKRTLGGIGDILEDQTLVVVGPYSIDIPPALLYLWECSAEVTPKRGFSSWVGPAFPAAPLGPRDK
jgi:hypothetical protein